MKEIVISTGNAGKVAEYKQMLEPFGYTVKCLKDFDPIEVVEDGTTFEENALIKARALFEHTGRQTLADDSGLEIEALDNKPGIYSARWLGSDTPYSEKNAEVLRLMADKENRKAQFTCVIAVVDNEGEHVFKGTFKGEIAKEAMGTNGFGYDPIFMIPELKKTSAQLTHDEKNAISHRGQALRQAMKYLTEE